jgi:hypothetical protein
MAKYAILHGNNYKGSDDELPYCEESVSNMETLLAGSKEFVIDKFYTITISDFIRKITSLSKIVNFSDTVLIMHSGLGTSVPTTKLGYSYEEGLVFYDNDFEIFLNNDLIRILNLLRCKVIVLLDSCFSESIGILKTTNNCRYKTYTDESIFNLEKNISKEFFIKSKEVNRDIHLLYSNFDTVSLDSVITNPEVGGENNSGNTIDYDRPILELIKSVHNLREYAIKQDQFFHNLKIKND